MSYSTELQPKHSEIHHFLAPGSWYAHELGLRLGFVVTPTKYDALGTSFETSCSLILCSLKEEMENINVGQSEVNLSLLVLLFFKKSLGVGWGLLFILWWVGLLFIRFVFSQEKKKSIIFALSGRFLMHVVVVCESILLWKHCGTLVNVN